MFIERLEEFGHELRRPQADYLKDGIYELHVKRKESLQEERINAQVAQLIYDLRKDAGLTQQQLAKMVGTTQSVISRLEDSDYDGHSLTMLERIANVLNSRIIIQAVKVNSIQAF